MKNSFQNAEKFLSEEQKAALAAGKKIGLTLEQVIQIFGYSKEQLSRPMKHNVITSPDLIDRVDILEEMTGRELHLCERFNELNEEKDYLTICRFFAGGDYPNSAGLELFRKA